MMKIKMPNRKNILNKCTKKNKGYKKNFFNKSKSLKI